MFWHKKIRNSVTIAQLCKVREHQWEASEIITNVPPTHVFWVGAHRGTRKEGRS